MKTPCAKCPKPFGLQAENLVTWKVFELMSTQLRVGGMGSIMGIDFAAFPVVCDAMEIPIDERSWLLEQLAELSKLVVKFWNKPKEDEE